MIRSRREGAVDLWYMAKAFDFDFSDKSLYCTKGLHLPVRWAMMFSGWLPRAVYRAATTDAWNWKRRLDQC